MQLLGAAIDGNEFRKKYVNGKANEWCNELKTLSNLGDHNCKLHMPLSTMVNKISIVIYFVQF